MKEHLFAGQQIVVLGLARSGVAVARLLHEAGAKVIVNDKKPREDSPEAEQLEKLGIPVICGGHPDDLIHKGIDLVVKNPGIPYRIPPLQKAKELEIPIVSEVEIAYEISRAPIIGITGSNGKTTTTTWVGEVLSLAGYRPVVAGNIGRALSEAAQEATEEQRLVVELSSFQLKGIRRFRPKIACLLNIYEAHIDYHETMEDYVTSKAKIFQNQLPEDFAVVSLDHPEVQALIPQIRAKLLPFSLKPLDYGVSIKENQIQYIDAAGMVYPIIPVEQLGVMGKHNVENALAVSAIAIADDVPLDILQQGLREFKGVEHRLEYVATVNQKKFYNDSKATNPNAAIQALNNFSDKVVLIAGGLDRGIDFSELLPYFESKVKALVTLGQSSEKIQRIGQLAGISLMKSVDTVDEAVRAAYSLASDGDTILLSPACASWDMFSSFEERGRIFKESVHNL